MRLVTSLAVSLSVLAAGASMAAAATTPRAPVLPKVPANSSTIAISADDRLVWVVNPDGNSVSVIRTDQNRVIRTIRTGLEPRSIALDPAGRYAYVANAEGGTISVIRILNNTPNRFRAQLDTRFGRGGAIVTGAEPWSIVASPDGTRVYVANSAQNTVSVIDVARRRKVADLNLSRGVCAAGSPNHFQPRGLAISGDSQLIYVGRFFAFVRPGGIQGTDDGRQGAVCQIRNLAGRGLSQRRLITLPSQVTGFTVDANGDGQQDPTSAFPNQIQSLAIYRNQLFVPNTAASPTGPLRFNVNTQSFVNVIDGANGARPRDASAAKFLNLHLGARDPEPGKRRLFFASPWAIDFAPGRGTGGQAAAYIPAQGSDLVVKVNVAGNGKLGFTVDDNTTRYIDLADPANPVTSGLGAGHTPQGIVINRRNTRAYVMNFVSRNVSVINLANDQVLTSIRTTRMPPPGSAEEVVHTGAYAFFSARGSFDRTPGLTVSTEDRLASEGWQSCASCHFEGTTDSVVWTFGVGPRKSVDLTGSFAKSNAGVQKVLNYSAIFDEIQDFELNIRNVSGPGNLAQAQTCSAPAPVVAPAQPVTTSLFDPNHGLLLGDVNRNQAPCTIVAFLRPNAGRPGVTITNPGGGPPIQALDAMKEWVAQAIRPLKGPRRAPAVTGGPRAADIAAGRTLFAAAGCQTCHGGPLWSRSAKNFTSPPAAADIATERTGTFTGNPIGAQFLPAFLRDIGSFNLGVAGQNNPFGANIGAVELTTGAIVDGRGQPGQDALGRDYNNDGRGNGYNPPSLISIFASPPYYHNGACENLECVVSNVRHRTANNTRPDVLVNPADQARLVAFLKSIDATTPIFP